jgi:hypothetical protein
MKKSLVITFTLLLCIDVAFLSAQDRDSPSIDCVFGATIGSGFTYGLAGNNIIKNTIGLYFLGHSFNTASAGGFSGDIHYDSSFGWETTYDTIATALTPWGMSFGLSLNFGKLLNKKNLGINLMTGLGFLTEQVEYYTSSTRYYNNPLLSTSTEIFVYNEKTTKTSIEVLVRYDFLKMGYASFFTVLGYYQRSGIVACLGGGFRM